jgi:hypothetical protein
VTRACSTHETEHECILSFSKKKPEGERPIKQTIYKCDYNIKMDSRKIGWGCELDSSGSGKRLVAGSCGESNETSGYVSCRDMLCGLASVSFSRRNQFHGVSYLSNYYSMAKRPEVGGFPC